MHVIYICFPYTFSLHMYARSYENDIAVIKLRQSSSKYQNVNFANSHYIWPICMPPIDTNWENYNGVVIGTYLSYFIHFNFVLFLLNIRIYCFLSIVANTFTLFRLGYPILHRANITCINEGRSTDLE